MCLINEGLKVESSVGRAGKEDLRNEVQWWFKGERRPGRAG